LPGRLILGRLVAMVGFHHAPCSALSKARRVRKSYRARPMAMRCLFTLLLALAACVAGAAEPLPPAVQNELDRAVLQYEQGRHTSARAAFERLARQGVPAAQYNLAVMHLRHELPRPRLAVARQLLEQAARGGFVTAQLMLGQAWESGQLGRRDLAAALHWYETAAEAGSVEAQVELATAFYLGRGRPRSGEQAAHWYREAAKAGDVGAMYLLASMYEQGDGVERDLRLARYWYAAAAGLGDEAAPGKLREIDALLAAQPG
jgi:TPR repeat protein